MLFLVFSLSAILNEQLSTLEDAIATRTVLDDDVSHMQTWLCDIEEQVANVTAYIGHQTDDAHSAIIAANVFILL